MENTHLTGCGIEMILVLWISESCFPFSSMNLGAETEVNFRELFASTRNIYLNGFAFLEVI
jgi:hypothetical protein